MARNPLIASEITPVGTAIVVRLRGELDRLTSFEVDRMLAEVQGSGKDIIVGLAGLTYLDLGGVKLLERAAQQSRDQGCRFVVAEAPPPIRRILDIIGFGQTVPILATVRDALNHLQTEGASAGPAASGGAGLGPEEPSR